MLLTRNQLSDVAQVVSTVLDAGEKSQQTATGDFFGLTRSAAANLARDPARLSDPSTTRLDQLGLLGEYLDDLPYKSDVMGLTRDATGRPGAPRNRRSCSTSFAASFASTSYTLTTLADGLLSRQGGPQ